MAKLKTTTIGYIVESRGGRAMEMIESGEVHDQGLYFENVATVFATHSRAKRAIRVTLERTPDFESRFGKLNITRVIAEQPSTSE